MRKDKNPKIVTLDYQPNTKHKLYHRLKNVSFLESNGQQQLRYCIELQTAADINKPFMENFLMFFESIYEVDFQSLQKHKSNNPCFNRLFVHCVHLWLLHDKFIPSLVNESNLEELFCTEMMGSYQLSASYDYELKKQFQELYNSQKIKINRLFSFQLSRERSQQLNKEGEWSIRLKVIYRIFSQLKRQVIASILAIDNPNVKRIYIPTALKEIEAIYLCNLVEQLQNLQPTKKILRRLKLNNFVFKRYESYFRTDYAQYEKSTKNRRFHPNKLLIQRYTENKREYLLNLKEMVAIRKQSCQYGQQSFEILQQLAAELQNHHRKTKSAYPLLDPNCVLFNQLSLKVQLSYQNPLLEALGLLKKPMNVETAICFKSSPKPFDSFSWINEIQNPYPFYDILYEMDNLIHQIHRDVPEQKSFNQTMSMIKDKQSEKSEIWRYLMVASYFMNGVEYHQFVNQPCLNLNDFRAFLLAQKRQIECAQQQGFIQKTLGSRFLRFLNIEKPSPVRLQRAFLHNLFENSEVDSIIEGMGLLKTTHFLQSRLTIAKKLIKLIEKSPFFDTVFNTIKYLVRFQVGIILELQLILQMCDCFQKDPKIGLNLQKECEESMIGENGHIYIKTALNKFKEYEHRNLIKQEHQFLFLLESYESMYRTKETVTQLIEKAFRYLKFFGLRQEISISEVEHDNDQMGEQLMASLQVQALKFLSRAKADLKTVVSSEFISKVRKKSHGEMNLVGYKVEVMVELLVVGQRGTYVANQSLIMPILEYQESHGISMDARQLREFYEDRCEGLLYALEILKEQALESSSESSCQGLMAQRVGQ